MFNIFRKAKKQYLVWKLENGCEDVYEVARFLQEESAKELCERKNREDKNYHYFYF